MQTSAPINNLYVALFIMRLVNIILLSFSVLASNAIASEESEQNHQWLRDDSRSNAKVIRYLEQRNRQVEQFQQALQPLSDALQDEWANHRVQRGGQPWLIRDGKEYLVTRVEGQRWLRVRDANSSQIVDLLNIEQRANQHDYYQLGGWSVSPDGRKIALTEDLVGNEQYQMVVVEVASGKEQRFNTNGDTTVIWSADSKSVYGIVKTVQDARPSRLVRYSLVDGQVTDVYTETDQTWLVSAYLASDRQFAIVQSNSESTSEQRVLDLSNGELSAPLAKRHEGFEYYADVAKGKLYVQSNRDGQFALYSSSMKDSDWQLIYAPSHDAELQTYYVFQSGLVAIEQKQGQKSLVILNHGGREQHRELLSPSGSVAWLSRVGDYASDKLRIRSMSMTQPALWEEFDVSTLTRRRLSEDTYPSYQAEEYHTETIFIPSGGVQVPVTLAYKASMLTERSPVVVYGYGAYGFTMKPYFMPQTISLMDRGIIYAIAHVRGGGYFGDAWHQSGRGVNKINGIRDFVAVSKAMSTYQKGLRKVAAIGSSAGGTLVAGALNQAPQLFSAVSLTVPFVDVVASMSDSTLPLTAQQFQEWGNPSIPEERAKMAQYDPILNLTSADYPATLVRVGWHDRRVPYWEGAKYLSQLEAISSGTGPYLLETDFESGHATDQRKSSQRQAMEYAFLIKQLQKSE